MATTRDDRILPFTRTISASIIVALLLAFLALYVESDHTDWDFAWTILPRTSAILIGAGYAAGAYFFARLVTDKRWHRVQAGFLPITAFTICMLAATFLHWSRFHHGALPFYLWTIIYALTPILVSFIWWHNRATGSNDLEENDLRFPSFVNWTLGLVGVIGVLIFLFIFIQPSVLIALTPWKLTELTARVFAGWSILASSTVLSIALDGRWSATRILMESAMVTIALTLLGLPRMWEDFDRTNPMLYTLVAGLSLALIVFFIMHFWLDRYSQRREFIKAGV